MLRREWSCGGWGGRGAQAGRSESKERPELGRTGLAFWQPTAQQPNSQQPNEVRVFAPNREPRAGPSVAHHRDLDSTVVYMPNGIEPHALGIPTL